MVSEIGNQSTSAEALLRSLETRESSIAIWGAGAIGSSAAYYFAQAGFRCIAHDISTERVREIAEGRFQSTAAHADGGGDFPVRPDLGVKATLRWRSLESESVAVHLVCVPTERAAEPSGAALADVIPNIAKVVRKTPPRQVLPILSIESTILPSWIDGIVIPALRAEGLTVGSDILVGAAPRRDWFNGADFTIKTLPRIVGGYDDLTTGLLAAFYATVCDTVQPAMDAEHAAFTKVIENVIRYEGITFGNRLSLAFPQYDMRHILRLASTKWNIPYYFPSLGVGGHCIPLAPQYLVEEGGAENPYLQSVRDSIEFNHGYLDSLYDRRLEGLLRDKRSVGVLGLAYTPNAKMHKLSPAFSVLDTLRDTPRLRLHDPYYTSDEIYDLCSVPELNFPDDLGDCDAIILVTAHSQYTHVPIEDLVEPGAAIIDNTGVWTHRPFKESVEYYEVGRIRGRPAPLGEPYSSLAD
jgi:nucleotide sugar dehydrogenase